MWHAVYGTVGKRGDHTGRTGRAGRALNDSSGEGVTLQRRREAALALVAAVSLKHGDVITRYTIVSFPTAPPCSSYFSLCLEWN